MQVIASIYLIYVICLVCRNLFVRRKLAAPLDSLRASHLHFVPIGIAAGVVLATDHDLAAVVEGIQRGLLGVILVWLGIVTGLRFDFRRLGRRASRHHALEGLQVVGTAALVFFLALLWRPVLRYQMGIAAEPALVALLLGVLACTLRMPDRIFYVRSVLVTPDIDQAPAGPLITNAVGMTLLTVLYPYCAGVTVMEVGPFTLVSTSSFWALYACAGILLGLLLTFVFSTFQEDVVCAIIAAGTVATFGGLCAGKAIPGVIVGFISGVWFINTTTRRRDALEILEKITGIVQPVFFLVIGGLLATQNLTVLRLTAFAFLFLVARSLARGISLTVAARLTRCYLSLTEIIGSALRPLGTLSVALAAQLLLLDSGPNLYALIAAVLVAAAIGQVLPLPKPRDVSA
ncbi:MAG: hypothetical protein J4F39_08475 [Candidatus Latescibacteria bacterium]|nr:hypothetical protein [Candidatus Latescibacterota bacterium]